MCHHAKFRQNRPNCFRDIVIFRFSRWLPSINIPNFIKIGRTAADISHLTFFKMAAVRHLGFKKIIFSETCNIYISRLCYDVSVRLSVRLSVTEMHWRIIANLGFTFDPNLPRIVAIPRLWSQPTMRPHALRVAVHGAHCGRGACREEVRDHLALC